MTTFTCEKILEVLNSNCFIVIRDLIEIGFHFVNILFRKSLTFHYYNITKYLFSSETRNWRRRIQWWSLFWSILCFIQMLFLNLFLPFIQNIFYQIIHINFLFFLILWYLLWGQPFPFNYPRLSPTYFSIYHW